MGDPLQVHSKSIANLEQIQSKFIANFPWPPEGVAEGSKRVAGSGSGRGGKKNNTLGANVGAIITVTLVDFVGHEKKTAFLKKKPFACS